MDMMMQEVRGETEEREWAVNLVKPFLRDLADVQKNLDMCQKNYQDMMRKFNAVELEVQKGERLLSRILNIEKQLNSTVRGTIPPSLMLVIS
jgi:TnpA family transposase